MKISFFFNFKFILILCFINVYFTFIFYRIEKQSGHLISVVKHPKAFKKRLSAGLVHTFSHSVLIVIPMFKFPEFKKMKGLKLTDTIISSVLLILILKQHQ